MSLKFNFRGSGSRSRSREKIAKFIPAAIIPSVAFIANPTVPVRHNSLNEINNTLLNSTMHSSILGMSQESLELNCENPSVRENIDENIGDNIISNTRSRSRKKKKKKGKDSPDKNSIEKDNKRHIERANGLYSGNSLTPSRVKRLEIQSNRHNGELSNVIGDESPVVRPDDDDNYDRYNYQPKVEFPSKRFGFGRRDASEDRIYHFNNNANDDMQNSSKRNISIGFGDVRNDESIDNHYIASGASINQMLPSVPLDSYEEEKGFRVDSQIDTGHSSTKTNFHEDLPTSSRYISNYPTRHSQNLLSSPHDLKTDGLTEDDGKAVPFVKTSPNPASSYPRKTKETEDRDKEDQQNISRYERGNMPINARNSDDVSDEPCFKQLKDEIHILKDTVYRLNVELSYHMSREDNGKSTGRSVLPGKGPIPMWLTNTKYLAPLFASHDEKCRSQALQIQQMQTDICNFEKDVRQILKENERLHLKLQENQRGGRPANNSELQVVVQQTKLVIEENRLLLEEIELMQKKLQKLEKEHLNEVTQLKKSLTSVTSERDALDSEISSLTRRIAEMKSSSQPISMIASEDAKVFEVQRDYERKWNVHVSELMTIKQEKLLLEAEINSMKANEKKLDAKVEKLKGALKSEREFRDYISDVIDKSNEIALDRDNVSSKLSLSEKEVLRIMKKMRSEIRHRSKIDIDDIAKISQKNMENVIIESVRCMEHWMEKLMRYSEELMHRCQIHEQSICYYQNLLKEKDKLFQESMEESKELDRRLDTILFNASN